MRAMCGVQLRDRKRAKDLKLLVDLNKFIDRLAPADSTH